MSSRVGSKPPVVYVDVRNSDITLIGGLQHYGPGSQVLHSSSIVHLGGGSGAQSAPVVKTVGNLLAKLKSEFDGLVLTPLAKMSVLEAESNGVVMEAATLFKRLQAATSRLHAVSPRPPTQPPAPATPAPPSVLASPEDGRKGVLKWLELKQQPAGNSSAGAGAPRTTAAPRVAPTAAPTVAESSTTPALSQLVENLIKSAASQRLLAPEGEGAPVHVEAVLEAKASATSLKEDLKKMDAALALIYEKAQGVVTVQTKQNRKQKVPGFAVRLPPADKLQIHYVIGHCCPAIGEDAVSIGGIFKASVFRHLLSHCKQAYTEDLALASSLPCPPYVKNGARNALAEAEAERIFYEVDAPEALFADFIKESTQFQEALQARVTTGMLSYWVPSSE